MTIANTFAAKLSVAFVAIAMALSMVAPAQAATTAEMQAQIDALMAKLAAMTHATMMTNDAGCYTFTRSLTIGSKGADVTALQGGLIAGGHTIAAGATGYFGGQTAAAVKGWQAANGVMPAAGYFGPKSQAKYAMTCAPAPTPTPTPTPTPGTTTGGTSTSGLTGEASLTKFETSGADDKTKVNEGSTKVQVANMKVKFSNGDAKITRLDISLVPGTPTPTVNKPWKAFDEATLWLDGKKVGTVDASSKDNYLDSTAGTLRFSGLDIVAKKDQQIVLTVALSVAGNINGAGTLANWVLQAESLRYVDASDVTSTESLGSTKGNVAFSIKKVGSSDNLKLQDSDANPQAATVQLSTNSNTVLKIFAFDLSAKDSDTDVKLSDLVKVGVKVSSSTVNTLVNDFTLTIDGKKFSSESYSGNAAGATVSFKVNGDVVIPAKGTVTAVLSANFNSLINGNQGSFITATTSQSVIDAEGKVSGQTITLGGSSLVQGLAQTLRSSGVAVTYVSDSVTAVPNDVAKTSDNAADYSLSFNVASFGDSIYLPFGATASTTMLDSVKFALINTNTGLPVATGTTTPGLTTSASGVTKINSFRVGSSNVKFALTVNYDPLVAGSYKLRLMKINYTSTDAGTATISQDVSALNIETAAISILQ